jgi:hypothetical protein
VFLVLQVLKKINSSIASSWSRWWTIVRALVIDSCNFPFLIYSFFFYLIYCNIHKNIGIDNVMCVLFNKAQGLSNLSFILFIHLYPLLLFVLSNMIIIWFELFEFDFEFKLNSFFMFEFHKLIRNSYAL